MVNEEFLGFWLTAKGACDINGLFQTEIGLWEVVDSIAWKILM